MSAFFVEGEPATAGSKDAFPFKRKDGSLGVAVRDVSDRKRKGEREPRGKRWRRLVQAAAEESGVVLVDDGPINLHVYFVLRRPKNHWLKSGELSKAGREKRAHVSTPDLSKLVRAVEDALKGIAWKDDSQVAVIMSAKKYQDSPGAEVGAFVRIERGPR